MDPKREAWNKNSWFHEQLCKNFLNRFKKTFVKYNLTKKEKQIKSKFLRYYNNNINDNNNFLLKTIICQPGT